LYSDFIWGNPPLQAQWRIALLEKDLVLKK